MAARIYRIGELLPELVARLSDRPAAEAERAIRAHAPRTEPEPPPPSTPAALPLPVAA